MRISTLNESSRIFFRGRRPLVLESISQGSRSVTQGNQSPTTSMFPHVVGPSWLKSKAGRFLEQLFRPPDYGQREKTLSHSSSGGRLKGLNSGHCSSSFADLLNRRLTVLFIMFPRMAYFPSWV